MRTGTLLPRTTPPSMLARLRMLADAFLLARIAPVRLSVLCATGMSTTKVATSETPPAPMVPQTAESVS